MERIARVESISLDTTLEDRAEARVVADVRLEVTRPAEFFGMLKELDVVFGSIVFGSKLDDFVIGLLSGQDPLPAPTKVIVNDPAVVTYWSDPYVRDDAGHITKDPSGAIVIKDDARLGDDGRPVVDRTVAKAKGGDEFDLTMGAMVCAFRKLTRNHVSIDDCESWLEPCKGLGPDELEEYADVYRFFADVIEVAKSIVEKAAE